MSSDVTNLHYWLDLGIKAAIGVLVSIISFDYRAVKNSLRELEVAKYHMSSEVGVVQSELTNIKQRLDRIEQKLDRVLEK